MAYGLYLHGEGALLWFAALLLFCLAATAVAAYVIYRVWRGRGK